MLDSVTNDSAIKATGKEIRALWKQIKKNETWVVWLELGEKIAEGHDQLMNLLGYNDARNPSFLKRWGAWLAEQGLDEIDKGVRSRLSFCVDHKDEIAKWQHEIGVAKVLLYNHPNSVYRNFMKSRGNGNPTPRERKTDRIEVVKRERDEALMEVARLADEVEAEKKRADSATASAGFMWDDTPVKVSEKMLQVQPEKVHKLAQAINGDWKEQILNIMENNDPQEIADTIVDAGMNDNLSGGCVTRLIDALSLKWNGTKDDIDLVHELELALEKARHKIFDLEKKLRAKPPRHTKNMTVKLLQAQIKELEAKRGAA
jgi:hypothetical protein